MRLYPRLVRPSQLRAGSAQTGLGPTWPVRLMRAVIGLGAIGAERAGPAARTGARAALGFAAIALGALARVPAALANRHAARRPGVPGIGLAPMARAAQGMADRMGRDRRTRRRGGEGEDFDLDDKLSAARRRWELEIRAHRDMDRQARRAAKRREGAWRLASVGSGLLVGGLSMDPLGELAAIGLGLLVGSLVGWVGQWVNARVEGQLAARSAVQVARRPEIEAPTLAENALPQGRAELVQKVLGEAAQALRALDGVIPRLRHPDSVASVARIVAVGNRLMQAVAASPDKLAGAQRIFTYYAPETVKVAEALARLETDAAPDLDRIHGTQSVLKKLEVLFERTELDLKADDGKALDIDLRLLDQSLEGDLKTRV